MVTSIAPNLGHGKFVTPRTFFTLEQSQVGNRYAIYCSSGTYAYTGTGPTFGIGLSASNGSYTFTGTGITLGVGLNVGSGSYSSTGTGITLGAGLNVNSGSYTFTGLGPTFDVGVSLGSSSYSLTGTGVNTFDIGINTSSGVYLVTGSVISFTFPPQQVFGGKTYKKEVYKSPKEVKIKSSNIDTVTFDERNKELNIKFKSGKTYTYANVHPKNVKGIQRASSAGKYFHRNVKGKYFASKKAEY